MTESKEIEKKYYCHRCDSLFNTPEEFNLHECVDGFFWIKEVDER